MHPRDTRLTHRPAVSASGSAGLAGIAESGVDTTIHACKVNEMQLLCWREFDAKNINKVLNEPRVRPWVADASEGVIDISAKVAIKENVLLMGQYGGVMFDWYGGGIYEFHTQLLPEGRGEWARKFFTDCAHFMFTRTDCCEALTRVPEGHIAAKAGALGLGMKFEFTRENECKFRGKLGDVSIYSYTIYDWIKIAPYITERGAWLHERMNEEALRIGITAKPHETDDNHNRYVGAAVEMGMNGQLRKAVIIYNRWALVSRHALVQAVQEKPPVIRMDIGLMQFNGDDIQIVREAA